MLEPRVVREPIALTSERLLIRPLAFEDVTPEYVAWMQDLDVTRFLEARFSSYTAEVLIDYVESNRADPDSHLLAIILNETRRHVGNIKLTLDRPHARGEIGIMIGDRSCWGKGLATEAIKRLCDWAFQDMRLHKLTAGMYASNDGSIGAFLQSGFQEEGSRPEHYWSDGSWVDALLLGRVNPTQERRSEQTGAGR